MLTLFISPFVLMLLLWIFARREAEISYRILFFIVVGLLLLTMALYLLSPWLSLAAFLVGLPLALARWCYISLPKAILITLLFLATLIGLDLLWEALFPTAEPPSGSA